MPFQNEASDNFREMLRISRAAAIAEEQNLPVAARQS
jgi:hypothetical protein